MKSKNQRQQDALALVNAWRELTPTQQLASLDARLGPGIGAKRQRTKLSAILNPVVATTPAPETIFVVNVALAETPKKKKFKKGNKPRQAEN